MQCVVERIQLLKSWILSSLSEESVVSNDWVMYLAEVWSALLTAYGAPTKACFQQLNIQFQSLRKCYLPITTYLRQVKLITKELAVVG